MELVSIVQCIRVLKIMVGHVELTHVVNLKSQLQTDGANNVRVAKHEAVHIPVLKFDVDQV